MGLPPAREGLCERRRRAAPCRLLAPRRVNGNQTSIIAPTTQERQDRGKAGARKEHCLIDEQIYLTRVEEASSGGGGCGGVVVPAVARVGSAASLVGGWARVTRLSFTWRSGASDGDRWVAPGPSEGVGSDRGKTRICHFYREPLSKNLYTAVPVTSFVLDSSL